MLRAGLQSVMDRHETIRFFLHHGIAFATQLLKRVPVEHGDLPPPVFDHTELKQSAGGLSNAFTPYAQNVRQHFLRHDDLGTRQAIEAQQKAATESLVNRMMQVAGGCLSHLRYQGLRVAKKREHQRAMEIKLLFE